MRICEITGGVVTNVIELPDSYSIASDKKSASGKASYEVQGPDGSEAGEYDGTYTAVGEAILVASTKGNVGWSHSGGKFTAPAPEPAQPKRQFSFLEFMDLFTDAEQLAIAGAAMTDAPTKLWYDRAVGAAFISLDDQRVPAGLQAMVDNDVITAARRDRVLQGLGPED